MWKTFFFLCIVFHKTIHAFQQVTSNNHVLVGHVFQQLYTSDWFNCIQACNDEPRCISYNYERSAGENGLCELNNLGVDDLCGGYNSLIYSAGFVYQQIMKNKSPEQDIETGESGSSTCKELCSCGRESRAYQLTLPGAGKILVYCHMTELGACGVGGWTLVMKIDGTKRTFHYDSELWSDKNTYNPTGGQTGFDSQETKLPTYWTKPFSKICLGMKIDGETRFALVNKRASSLYSLIADGQFRPTSLGRDAWKSLIGSQASLQLNCNKEGFSCFIKEGWLRARIGIVSNEQNDCFTPDSIIGFGTAWTPDDNNTCGNAADGNWSPDNGAKDIKAMGYIFVQ